MNKVKGKVHEVQTQTGKGEKGDWKRTTIVVETASKFNNLVPISFFNEDISASKGDEVEVDFYVGGREYQGKYYAQLDGNNVTVVGGQDEGNPPRYQPSFPDDDEDDDIQDLPF